ncbi:cobalt-precorrin 5A hydrolase [Clostridium malenominatum]|uniref:Cobalt-precorrin 5A hydrolase n=1 Tax=Clostridium malenominatum TaxID=1539 RepID=A0ABP3UH13_9CLOT
MKIAIITITKNGDIIADKIKETLPVKVFSKERDEDFSFKEAVRTAMENYSGVIFIASTGIAVRAIIPYIKGKDKDPAVITIDNLGKFVISLLSGHLGGANELTETISKIIHGVPVITTATDGLGILAPDMVAKENDLEIDCLKDAKDIASLLVAGEKVYFHDEDNIIPIPKGYSEELNGALGIVYVTNRNKSFWIEKEKIKDPQLKILKLIRKNIVLGIGCRKDFSVEEMRKTVLEVLIDNDFDPKAVKSIGTVEVKKDEKAIIDLSNYFNCPLKIFSIEDIKAIDYKFKGSNFVEKTIGVRSVCEPSVELQGGTLLIRKLKLNGMTVAVGIY